MTARLHRRLAILPVLAAWALASSPVRADEAAPPAPRTTRLEAGVQEQDAGGRRVIADSQSLVWRSGDPRPGLLSVSDLSREEALNIERINATRGTYQSYLLATREDLPVRLHHPGFTITLPPPRKRPPAADEEPLVASPPEPAGGAR